MWAKPHKEIFASVFQSYTLPTLHSDLKILHGIFSSCSCRVVALQESLVDFHTYNASVAEKLMREACLPYILQQKLSPSDIQMADGFPSITSRMYQNHPNLPACSLVGQHLADGPSYFLRGHSQMTSQHWTTNGNLKSWRKLTRGTKGLQKRWWMMKNTTIRGNPSKTGLRGSH